MVTAKVKVSSITPNGDDQSTVSFTADYADDRNKEWALYTPAMSIVMTVKNSVLEHFAVGDAFTLEFVKD